MNESLDRLDKLNAVLKEEPTVEHKVIAYYQFILQEARQEIQNLQDRLLAIANKP